MALNPEAAVRTRVVSGANRVSRDAASETSGERVYYPGLLMGYAA
jgi:hypothetical protein